MHITFCHAVNCEAREPKCAPKGGYVDDATSSCDGGPEEQGVRQLAQVEARL